MVIWLMSAAMDHEGWLILATIIIIVLLLVILRLLYEKCGRDQIDRYNLEYPQDYQSAADEDMRDRFSGKHFK